MNTDLPGFEWGGGVGFYYCRALRSLTRLMLFLCGCNVGSTFPFLPGAVGGGVRLENCSALLQRTQAASGQSRRV